MNRESKSGWLLIVMAGIMAGVIGFGLIYINFTAERFVEESEKRDCGTLAVDIAALEELGQVTQSGANLSEARRYRYKEIGCRPELPPPTFTIITPTPIPTPSKEKR